MLKRKILSLLAVVISSCLIYSSTSQAETNFSDFVTTNETQSEKVRCPSRLGELPIQAGGRIKPLSVHAREMLKLVTGKSSHPTLSPIDFYCRSSFSFLTSYVPPVKVRIDHEETFKNLGIKNDNSHSFPLQELLPRTNQILNYAQDITIKEKKGGVLNDAKALASRISGAQTILLGQDWKIPFVVPHDANAPQGAHDPVHWISVSEIPTLMGQPHLSASEILAIAEKTGLIYQKEVDDHYLIEYWYDKLRPFHIAISVLLLASVITFLKGTPRHKGVLAINFLLILIQALAIATRIIISNRGPVTNMYETVMWVGFGSVIFALIISWSRNDKIILLMGQLMNLITLFMMSFATDMLDASIQPLVPVLRDNFWLSTHVTSITISYASLALSWLLANLYLIRFILGKAKPEEIDHFSKLAYDAIKIGVVLLAAGIILGGVWADYSWGRFWGWDPKETWALIALLCYMIILHGRYAGWIKSANFLSTLALAYLSIIMAWFGVNYVLAAGLHSYGFSNGGAVFISSVVIAQITISLTYEIKKRLK